MKGKIFISYRRDDSRGVAGRLYDRLEAHFGRDRIFMDVDSIQPGLDFVEEIEKAVSSSDVFLVVIGQNWANSRDAEGNRRLENPEDFVRLEVATALARNMRVIPVLVDRSTMPHSTDLPENLKSLVRRNAIEISHTRFSTDTERLIRVLEQIFEQFAIEQVEAEKSEVDHEVVRREDGIRKPATSEEPNVINNENVALRKIADDNTRRGQIKHKTDIQAPIRAEGDVSVEKMDTIEHKGSEKSDFKILSNNKQMAIKRARVQDKLSIHLENTSFKKLIIVTSIFPITIFLLHYLTLKYFDNRDSSIHYYSKSDDPLYLFTMLLCSMLLPFALWSLKYFGPKPITQSFLFVAIVANISPVIVPPLIWISFFRYTHVSPMEITSGSIGFTIIAIILAIIYHLLSVVHEKA